jgi:hypothetical protein
MTRKTLLIENCLFVNTRIVKYLFLVLVLVVVVVVVVAAVVFSLLSLL